MRHGAAGPHHGGGGSGAGKGYGRLPPHDYHVASYQYGHDNGNHSPANRNTPADKYPNCDTHSTATPNWSYLLLLGSNTL